MHEVLLLLSEYVNHRNIFVIFFSQFGLFYRSKAVLFCGSFMFFCLVSVMPFCASVYLCLVVTCWERADLLPLVCAWYLIVSIPDLCTLTYFVNFLFDFNQSILALGSL